MNSLIKTFISGTHPEITLHLFTRLILPAMMLAFCSLANADKEKVDKTAMGS